MKRNNLDICADILTLSLTGARKTKLVYGANLNFNIVKKYLEGLLKLGLLKHEPPKYYTTPKGVLYINRYEAFNTIYPRVPLVFQ